jgi:hypothetical protein
VKVGYLLAAGGPALFGLLHDLTGGWTVRWSGWSPSPPPWSRLAWAPAATPRWRVGGA